VIYAVVRAASRSGASAPRTKRPRCCISSTARSCSASLRPAWMASVEPVAPAAREASAHALPLVSMPSARSSEGEPGPHSTSVVTAAISARLYS
jgi:hypothetical protein